MAQLLYLKAWGIQKKLLKKCVTWHTFKHFDRKNPHWKGKGSYLHRLVITRNHSHVPGSTVFLKHLIFFISRLQKAGIPGGSVVPAGDLFSQNQQAVFDVQGKGSCTLQVRLLKWFTRRSFLIYTLNEMGLWHLWFSTVNSCFRWYQ